MIPNSFNQLRYLITQIRARFFVANLVREGQFTEIDQGVTFSFRETLRRGADGDLSCRIDGIRNAHSSTFAEVGQIASIDDNSYLVLERGSVHTQSPGSSDSSIVAFETVCG